MIKKGTLVKIKSVLLKPEQRANNIPEAARLVPLNVWVKGRLINDGEIGDTVEVLTVTGRFITGVLEIVNPTYSHSYGDFVPELIHVRDIIRCERERY
jgi:hypothetical protein